MIYIQSTSDRTRPHHFDAACGMFGAIDTGAEYRLTSFEEVESGKFNALIRTNLFVGSVEFMREVFAKANVNPRMIMNTDRPVYRRTMAEIRKDVNNDVKWFVKPFQQKLFTGLVVDKYSISSLREFSDDLEVMAYVPLPKILSEWRTYVLNGQIQDCRNYAGDFRISPNYDFIEEKIRKYRDKLPVAFTLDVGVHEGNGDVIIEFNDMYAIGNYGLPNDTYLIMLRQRYFEIMRQNN